jgi:putative phage-type endonuclease
MKKLSDNKKLVLIDTKDMPREEWLKRRHSGIGGSEVGAILGLNPYSSAIEVFYQKIEKTPENIENEPMFWGKMLEDKVATVWQYYEKDKLDFQSMSENFKAGRIKRESREIYSIIRNPDYPYFFANIDRLIVDENGDEGVLEIKTAGSFALKKWEAGLPPYYLIQLQTYMLIAGLEYGEIAVLKDGRNFEIFPVKRNDEIIGGIIDRCNDFYARIEEARKLDAAGKPFEHLEPEPDDTEAYEKFMEKRYVSKPIKLEGTQDILNTAKSMVSLNDDKKKIETEYQKHKNKIIAFMREADTVDFGASGTITYKANSKGTKVFNNYVKILD